MTLLFKIYTKLLKDLSIKTVIMYACKTRDKVLAAKIWNNNNISNFASSKWFYFIWMEKYMEIYCRYHQYLQMHISEKSRNQIRQQALNSNVFKMIKCKTCQQRANVTASTQGLTHSCKFSKHPQLLEIDLNQFSILGHMCMQWDFTNPLMII